MQELLFIFVSLLTAVGRLIVPGHSLSLAGSYEALAHVWVGVLIAAAILSRNRDQRIFCWILLGSLTAIEIVEFLLRH